MTLFLGIAVGLCFGVIVGWACCEVRIWQLAHRETAFDCPCCGFPHCGHGHTNVTFNNINKVDNSDLRALQQRAISAIPEMGRGYQTTAKADLQ
jgi:hypothetical protein